MSYVTDAVYNAPVPARGDPYAPSPPAPPSEPAYFDPFVGSIAEQGQPAPSTVPPAYTARPDVPVPAFQRPPPGQVFAGPMQANPASPVFDPNIPHPTFDPVKTILGKPQDYAPISSGEASVASYDQTLRDKLGQAIYGDKIREPGTENIINYLIGSRGLGSTGNLSAIDFTPVGAGFQVQEAKRAGDAPGMAMAALGLIPGLGEAGAVEREVALGERAMPSLAREGTAAEHVATKVMPESTAPPISSLKPAEPVAAEARGAPGPTPAPESLPVTVGGKDISVVKRPGEDDRQLANVNVARFDPAFALDRNAYVGPGGSGGIGEGTPRSRYDNFGQFLQNNNTIEAPTTYVKDDGSVVFSNGRHRYAVMRDQGTPEIPMSLDPESLANAKRYGYVADDAGAGAPQNLDQQWREAGAPPPFGHNAPPAEEALPAPGDGRRISTRIPTSAATDVDAVHNANDLIVGLQSSVDSPEAFKKNADIIRSQYLATGIDPNQSDAAVTEQYIEHLRSNINAIYNRIPPELREQTKGWYDGANRISTGWAKEYNISNEQSAGVLAALSPQMDWYKNVSLARRILDITRDQGDTVMTPEMEKWLQNYIKEKGEKSDGSVIAQDFLDRNHGKTLNQMTDSDDKAHFIRAYDEVYNPRGYTTITPQGISGGQAMNQDGSPAKVGWGSMREIGKAASVLQDGSPGNISRSMGGAHKVRNFYNNIVAPNAPYGDITVDTHAIAGGNLFPLTGDDLMTKQGLGQSGSSSNATGSNGLYGLYAEAYRRAAQDQGIMPRQMQSITWDGARTMFPAERKAKEDYRDKLSAIWQQFHDGKISLEEGQRQLFDAAEGDVANPDWLTAKAPQPGAGYQSYAGTKFAGREVYGKPIGPFGGTPALGDPFPR